MRSEGPIAIVGSDRESLVKAEWFREIWRYRELFYFMVWRDVKVRYKQTVLGASWAIIQPVAATVVFTLFFNRMAKIEPPNGIPYPIFSYSGLLLWTYFSATLGTAGNSLVLNRELISKVYFPRATIPAAPALAGLVDLSIASVILGGMMVYYRMPPDWGLLLCPLLVALIVLLAAGVGMILASLNVRYRDVKYATPFLIQLWLFLSPIIYPAEDIPEKWRWVMALNPLNGIIEGFRACIFPVQSMDWVSLGISAVVTLAILVVGALYFRKTERAFADII